MRSLVPALVLLLLLGAAAQSTKPKEQPPSRRPAAQSVAAPVADPAEIDALRADVQRMQVILNQMRTNLGYVSTTTQPLRHQFELEIDMWQTVIGQTERRIRKLEAQEKR
jgi:hypothetical protein